ncbi:MAG: LCP family protein [Carnobacterium sp.]|uniref:LCP family glycopolymer transferase n=1 Tax=Carnobacterium sp. TaxID=48221 RepID=UPI00331551DC
MPNKRSEKQTNKRSHKVRVLLILALVLLVTGGLFGWKVYIDVRNASDTVFKNIETENKRSKPIDVKVEDHPFSMLLLGTDSGDLGRTEKGRSDTVMLLTVNKRKEKMTILSIPRDTYTEIIGHGTKDKINHAYAFGGVQMSINTVQNLLNIPIDYYVEINMKGLQELADALGGVTITPPLTFIQDGHEFSNGEPTKMSGEKTLAYTRMRYEDPQGDYGRQARQRQVLDASIKKASSFSSILKYRELLNTLENNMKTNLTFENMVDIFNDYSSAAANIEQIQLSGTGEKMNDIYYEMVTDEEVNRVSNLLREQLELDNNDEENNSEVIESSIN